MEKSSLLPYLLLLSTKSKTLRIYLTKTLKLEIDHITVSRWADIIVVMPTTANFMTKLTLGKAEDLATTVILAIEQGYFISSCDECENVDT